MRKVTPKRLAAALVLTDLEIVTQYWEERYPGVPKKEEVQRHLEALVAPLVERCHNLVADSGATKALIQHSK